MNSVSSFVDARKLRNRFAQIGAKGTWFPEFVSISNINWVSFWQRDRFPQVGPRNPRHVPRVEDDAVELMTAVHRAAGGLLRLGFTNVISPDRILLDPSRSPRRL
jgi:hypothetical protein